MVRQTRTKPSYVAVVAENHQTLADLDSYFSRVGIASDGTRELRAPSAIARAATALVLFPDDYRAEDAQKFVLALRRARPKLLLVLVTSSPRTFDTAIEPDGRTTLPIVLPKPAFGWTILDAIRGLGSRIGTE